MAPAAVDIGTCRYKPIPITAAGASKRGPSQGASQP